MVSSMTFFIVFSLAVPSDAFRPWTCTATCKCASDPHHPHGIVVNCRGQGLLQVPPNIPSNTTTLLLARNKLTRLPDSTFSRLGRLLKLDLAFNSIHTIEEKAFIGLGRLITLSLAGNDLVLSPATYPARVFQPLASLQVLRLNRNHKKRSDRRDVTSTSSAKSRKLPSNHPAAPFPLGKESGFLRNNEVDAQKNDSSVQGHMPSYRGDEEHALGTSNSTKLRFEKSDQTSLDGAVPAQDYPDEALSYLKNLRELDVDGLTNKTLGPGFRNLTQLISLDFSGNCRMKTVSSQTLANALYLHHVNFSHCDIVNLTADAFEALQDLRVLDLSSNFALGFDRLGDAFEGLAKTKLENLKVDSVVSDRALGTQITKDHMRHFKKLNHLRALQARFNRIESFEEGALCNGTPPNLKHVYLNANLLELAPYVNDLRCLESLEVLYIDGYNNYWTPPLRPPGFSNPPAKYKTDPGCVSPGRYGTLPVRTDDDVTLQGQKSEFILPPNLRVFKARHFGLFYKLQQIHVNPNNSLEVLLARENHFPTWEGPVTGLENLSTLDLSKSYASGNQLRTVFWGRDSYAILGGLNNLQVLDMSDNNLGYVHEATFINLTNLERLSLATNGLSSLNLVVSHMKNLTYLDISENQLHTLPKSVRDHLDAVAETQNVTISMTYNPIACICQNIDFLTWMRDSEVNFGTHYDYFCQLADGSEKKMTNIWNTIDELKRTCGSYVGVFVGAVASSLLFLVLLLVALAYRFRWKLRYLYYATRLSFQRNKRHHDDRFEFDAFVSFAGEDMEFVDGEMKEELEEGRGLKLCIHERDFVPGQYIASNIVDFRSAKPAHAGGADPRLAGVRLVSLRAADGADGGCRNRT
ncbi:hypothetical protein BaRGS_00038650 [Batillaria attramentaria]|uniref:TIR domain-containing protein n=1 Tax=Batillaria attramentaria TaxID=370345 RepID=A0ABD0J684_9CAEN